MGRCLRPKPGARALDAGPRKQVCSLRDDRLPPAYWTLKRLCQRGVTTFTSLPGIWITRAGGRPSR